MSDRSEEILAALRGEIRVITEGGDLNKDRVLVSVETLDDGSRSRMAVVRHQERGEITIYYAHDPSTSMYPHDPVHVTVMYLSAAEAAWLREALLGP